MFYLQSAPVAVVALLATVATAACKEHGSSAVSRTTGGPAEVLREGSSIKVDGTADHGFTISVYIKDAGNSLAKDLPARFIITCRVSSGSWQRPGRVQCSVLL
jgi:hypothetical protein